MNTKHTPGPWHLNHFEKFPASIHCAGGYVAQATSGSMFELTEEQRHANARLIAAAPELLEALKNLDDAVNEPSLGIDIVEASNKARAAIAKATQS